MARYDKYEPLAGGFRAPLAADYAGSDTPIGVSVNSSGRLVPGAGNTGIIGVLLKREAAKAGDVVDVMDAGDIVSVAGFTAGTVYTANTTTGVISSGAASGTQIKVGFTVEATRLVVRVAR